MTHRRIEQFDQSSSERLYEEFVHYNTLGHVALLCARPDFLRHLTHVQKTEIAVNYETSYHPDLVAVNSIDHANAHLAIELQRSAFTLSTFAIRQLRLSQREDLLAVIRGSHLASPQDGNLSRLDFAHRLIQASPPTHADALAPLLPPDTPPDH